MARSFNGTTDQITFIVGTALAAMRFGTIMAVVNRSSNATWCGPCNLTDGAGNFSFLDIAPSTASPANAIHANWATDINTTTITDVAADGWVILGASKATGSSAVHFHKYNFGTTTWTHQTVAAVADVPSAPNSMVIGNAEGDFFAGAIDVVAYFPTAIADATVEGFSVSLTNWDAQSPAGMWVLDQASTATAVPDRTGNGSTQNVRTGTTVTTGSPLTAAGVTAAATRPNVSNFAVQRASTW